MAKKYKTNEQMLRALLADLNTIEAACLRERIVTLMQETVKAVKESPESFRNPIVHPNVYLRIGEKVEKHLGFDKD